jgi:hypothetical protein
MLSALKPVAHWTDREVIRSRPEKKHTLGQTQENLK